MIKQSAGKPRLAALFLSWKPKSGLCNLRSNDLLESFRQTHVNEAASRIIGKAGITGRVSALAGREGRIFIEDINAPDGEYSAFQEVIPEAHLARNDLGSRVLVVLGISGGRGHRFRNKGTEIVGGLQVKEPTMLDVVDVQVSVLLVKTVDIANGPDKIKALPTPIEKTVASPSVISLL